MPDEALAAVGSAIELGFLGHEIESWPALVRLVQDTRYGAFIEIGAPDPCLSQQITNRGEHK
jgi:hypothetical protein